MSSSPYPTGVVYERSENCVVNASQFSGDVSNYRDMRMKLTINKKGICEEAYVT